MNELEYDYIIVESYYPEINTGFHGPVHVRPLKDQYPYLDTYHVECSKTLKTDYPVGTKFRIKAKISQRENGGKFVYNNHRWNYEVLK